MKHRFENKKQISIQIQIQGNNLSEKTLLALDGILYTEQTKASEKISLDPENISLRIIYHPESLCELRPIISRLIANMHHYSHSKI